MNPIYKAQKQSILVGSVPPISTLALADFFPSNTTILVPSNYLRNQSFGIFKIDPESPTRNIVPFWPKIMGATEWMTDFLID